MWHGEHSDTAWREHAAARRRAAFERHAQRRQRVVVRRYSAWRHNPVRLAILLALVQVFGVRILVGRESAEVAMPLDPLAYVLLVTGPLALMLRHRQPVLALAGALAPTAVYFGLGYPFGPGFVAAIVAVAVAVDRGRLRETAALVGLGYALYAALALVVDGVPTVRVMLVGLGSGLLVLFAEARRIQREQYAEMMKAHAAQRRAEEEQERAEAERQRAVEEQQRRQASEERLRIARELHDVLGHHLSLISVQAGVGLHLMDSKPDQARASLEAIKHASAEALRETRAVLAALHPREETAPRAPAPGLAGVPGLIADVEAAGLSISFGTDGAWRTLPPEVDRAAYRIVQEALTNVRRHAGAGANASVTLAYEPDALTVRVSDNGSGCAASDVDGGNGIAGMRQRALALGGSVRAEPGPAGRGFTVFARLPAPARAEGDG